MTLHSASSRTSTAFVVAPRGLIGPASSRTTAAPSSSITPDGTRFRVHHQDQQPLQHQMMGGGLEMEVLGFAKDALTAAVMGGSGDIIAQFAEKKRADDSSLLQSNDLAAADEQPFELDVRRSLSYATFAAGYTGGFQHFLFSGLQETISDPLVRTGINQGLIIPLCYYSLLVWLVPKLRATSKREEETLRSSIDVKKMIPRNWLFWVPLQWIQFTFIPMEFQIMYCSVLGLIWNICLSLMTAGGAKEEVPAAAVGGKAMVQEVKINAPRSDLLNAYQSAGNNNNGMAPITRQIPNSAERAARWMNLLSDPEENKESVTVEAEQEKERVLNRRFRR